MEQLLPQATPALAKAVWERQQSPSARTVARALAAAGYPVHFVTVARWKAMDWRAQESRNPLAGARAALESTAPLVTGIPQTSIDDLIRQHSNRESLEKLTDDELLGTAAREVAIALIIIVQAMRERATFLVTTKLGDYGLAEHLVRDRPGAAEMATSGHADQLNRPIGSGIKPERLSQPHSITSSAMASR
jgi:hypothetical protein